MLLKTTTTLVPSTTATSSSAAPPDAHSLARNATSTAVLVASAAASGNRMGHNAAVYAMVGLLVCCMGLLMVNLCPKVKGGHQIIQARPSMM